jgi:hypothetical protein
MCAMIVHLTGDWGPGRVSTSWTSSTRAIVPEVEQLVERTWSRAVTQPGIHLFDGPLCRLESWRATGEGLHLVLSTTSYKAFFGTNLHNPHLADHYDSAILANPVGVSASLVTSDGFLMFGRRNASVAYYPHKLHPFAGAVEPREDLDVFDEVRRELREELSLDPHELADIRCTGFVEDAALRQPELIFAVRSTRPRGEIERQVDQKEHGGSWSIPATRDGVERALSNTEDFTPVAIASLLLWGRLNFGEDWFVTQAHRFRYDAAASRDER